jgi:hypothetical protein
MYTICLMISTLSLSKVATHYTKDSLLGVRHLTQISCHQPHRWPQSRPRTLIRLDNIDYFCLHPILLVHPVLPLRTGLAPFGQFRLLLLQSRLLHNITLVLLLLRCCLKPVLLHLFLCHPFSSSASSLCFLCLSCRLGIFLFFLLFCFCDFGSSSLGLALLGTSDGGVDVLKSAPASRDDSRSTASFLVLQTSQPTPFPSFPAAEPIPAATPPSLHPPSTVSPALLAWQLCGPFALSRTTGHVDHLRICGPLSDGQLLSWL